MMCCIMFPALHNTSLSYCTQSVQTVQCREQTSTNPESVYSDLINSVHIVTSSVIHDKAPVGPSRLEVGTC